MAYKTSDLLKRSIQALENDEQIIFIEDVCVEIGVSNKTFYSHKLHESNELKDLLLKNKQNIKRKLRKKWFDGNSQMLQLALYKLCANPNELAILNSTDTKDQDQNQTVSFEFTEVK